MKKAIKMILIILATIVVLISCAVVWFYTLANSLSKEHKPAEVIIGSGEKSALVIYEPSMLSTTKDISMTIAEALAEEGFTVTLNLPSPQLDYKLADYDFIAFGSPVYAGRISSALKSYVEKNPVENKHILVYVTGGLVDDTKELEEMVSWVNPNNTVRSIKVNKGGMERLSEFVKEGLAQ